MPEAKYWALLLVQECLVCAVILITRPMRLQCGTSRFVQCGPRVCAGRIGMCRNSHSDRGDANCQEGISPTSLSTVLFHCFGRWQGEPSISSLAPPLCNSRLVACSRLSLSLLLLKLKIGLSISQSSCRFTATTRHIKTALFRVAPLVTHLFSGFLLTSTPASRANRICRNS